MALSHKQDEMLNRVQHDEITLPDNPVVPGELCEVRGDAQGWVRISNAAE